MTNQNNALLVVGSVALDSVETPAGSREDALGGSASFFSLAAVRYCPVRLVAVAGTDFPTDCRALFETNGIDLEGLQTAPGRTFRWAGVYSEDMNDRETLRTELNVFEDFHPELPDSYRRTPIVLLANIAPELQLEVVRQIENPKLVALDTMNFWIESKRDSLVKVLGSVDLLFLNEEEAKQLTGIGNVLRAARAIREMGPDTVVVKRGEYGALALTAHGWFSLPAFPVEDLKDPTGAGDSFAGGMLGYLANCGAELTDANLRRAIVHGTAVASFTVQEFSVDGLTSLSRDDIDRRTQEIWEVCRFDLTR